MRPTYCDCCGRAVWADEEHQCDPPADDAPAPDDAGLLSSWSGHDWYRDLGGESGHE